ncbi:MAG: thrombospondin type 3 repeat-containing protein [Pleurocapsa minor GSE-CHR-MK-17-07R]|nr:thrombospondin type 3 repeat-containing protein [Pleurocapsa minor GSE-CHR-MK 17-07R]
MALALVMLLVAALLLPLIRPVQAASAGCSAVSSLSADYPASEAFNIGSSEFFAGDQINLSVTIDGPSDLRLLIEGPSTYDVTSGDPQSYTIPTTGFYNVTVENTLAQAIPGVSVSCIPSGAEVTEDPGAQTATQGFFLTQNAVLTIVAETQSAAGTIAAQTQIAGATQTTIWNLLTQTAVTGQTLTAQVTPTPSPWPGLTDGRLNAQIDEPFSLWCANNLLSIYRSVNGQGQLLATYPLTALLSRFVGSVTNITTGSGPLTLTRLTNEFFTISGSIGTNAPAFGVKQFSLEACIRANGGYSVPTQTPSPAPTLTPSLVPSATPVGFPTATATPNNSIASLLFGQPVTSSNDRDGDGVRNTLDLCPEVFAPPPLLQFGCPDSDSDGLSDPLDSCPREPGLPGSLVGCPDYDGDGFVGQNDYCPFFAPPAGAGIAFGCSDGDLDGYPNAALPNGQMLDWCPLRGIQLGVTHWMGCPDIDNDGLIPTGPLVPIAWRDECPASPFPPFADGSCQAENLAAPVIVVNTSLTLFQFASSVGAFDDLVIETSNGNSSCTRLQLYSGGCVSSSN